MWTQGYVGNKKNLKKTFAKNLHSRQGIQKSIIDHRTDKAQQEDICDRNNLQSIFGRSIQWYG